MTEPSARRIASLFDTTFADYHTVMRGGASEPEYMPAAGQMPAVVVYTRDYPASALHEAAHWCLAGARRRLLDDYGYWYAPGPRSAAMRDAFFAAEVRVQALECVFAAAAGVRFVVSADDFAAPDDELERFTERVEQCAAALATALPRRAQRFRDALALEFCRG